MSQKVENMLEFLYSSAELVLVDIGGPLLAGLELVLVENMLEFLYPSAVLVLVNIDGSFLLFLSYNFSISHSHPSWKKNDVPVELADASSELALIN